MRRGGLSLSMKLDSKRNVFLFVLSALLLVTVVLNWPRIEHFGGRSFTTRGERS